MSLKDSKGSDQTVDAQANLNYSLPHMAEDIFSYGEAHIMLMFKAVGRSDLYGKGKALPPPRASIPTGEM